MRDGGRATARLIYQVAVGPRRPLWERCIETVAAYCARHGIEHRVQREPILRIRPNPLRNQRSEGALKLGYLPIYEKENALGLLGEPYDQIAVIDADVWISADAPDVFEANAGPWDFAAVVERDMPITEAYARKIAAYARGQYGRCGFPFSNMGVMLLNASLREHVPESPAEFLARPEFADYIDGRGAYRWSTDQTLLNNWLASSPGVLVCHLNWRWNALYGALRQGLLEAAHFVHFFLSDHLRGDDPVEMLRTGTARARV